MKIGIGIKKNNLLKVDGFIHVVKRIARQIEN